MRFTAENAEDAERRQRKKRIKTMCLTRSAPLTAFSSLCVLCVLGGESLRANPPVASYIFPAGGRRGTTVEVRVGGLFLHKSCPWKLLGPGVEADRTLKRTSTIWFEGPILPLPDSQQAED